MPQFIITVLLIILAVWLLGIISSAALASLPVWGTAIVVGSIIQISLRSALKQSTLNEALSRSFITIRFDGKALSAKVNKVALRGHLKDDNSGVVSVTAAIMIASLVFLFLAFLTDQFHVDPWEQQVSPVLGTIAAAAFSATALGIWISKTASLDRFCTTISDDLLRLVEGANRVLSKMDTFNTKMHALQRVSASLGLSFPEDHSEKVVQYLVSNLEQVIANPTSLDLVISDQIRQIDRDVQALKEAQQLFLETEGLYRQTASQVRSSGSISLLNELDHLG